MKHILYIHSTQVPPSVNKNIDRFFLLSETLDGDILHPIWFETPGEVEAMYGPGSFPIYTSGRFRYHWFLAKNQSKLTQFWFYIREGIKLHRQKKFDCIVAYSHMTTGVIATLLKCLTGAKLIIEVVIMPQLAYLTEYSHLTLRDRLMKIYSDVCLHMSVGMANCTHLEANKTAQFESYPLLRKVKTSVFNDFVSISSIPRHEKSQEQFVLSVGSPWYRKGMDRTIAAFKLIENDFPDTKLKLVGWYLKSEYDQLTALIGNNPQIELVRARPNILQLISQCAVLVQPSRCEGGPRIVIEGLATGVPVIGSDVGYMPELIHNGKNGYIVPGDNIQELSDRIREVLADSKLADSLGNNGYEFAHRELSEQMYIEKFTRMVESC